MEEEIGVAIAKGTSDRPEQTSRANVAFHAIQCRRYRKREKEGNRRGIVLASKVGDEW
jgi:hypothetical protein